MKNNFDSYKIEQRGEAPRAFVVYGFGQYPRSSVNFGMRRKAALGFFGSVEEAKAEYPDASYSGSIEMVERDPGPFPPRGFDPADAGERWDDDY